MSTEAPDVYVFYLQDSRSYTGNNMMWWGVRGSYTSDLNQAQVFTKESAQAQHNCRETDIPWPKAYIDQRVRPAVDHQNCDRKEALENSGITLKAYKRPARSIDKCAGCGAFMSSVQLYVDGCAKCGMDNRP